MIHYKIIQCVTPLSVGRLPVTTKVSRSQNSFAANAGNPDFKFQGKCRLPHNIPDKDSGRAVEE